VRAEGARGDTGELDKGEKYNKDYDMESDGERGNWKGV
jgi:hypothetical protein